MSVYIHRLYTKTGDRGDTALVGGKMVRKDSSRIECYGTVDELNAVVGLVRHFNRTEVGSEDCRQRIDAVLERVQNELFNLGSLLATLPESLKPEQPRIEERHVEALERDIDDLNQNLPALRSFTLPGGGAVAAHLHLARTVCRRAERCVVSLMREESVDGAALRYLNRLSDTLYVLGRWNARERGEAESLWDPKRS